MTLLNNLLFILFSYKNLENSIGMNIDKKAGHIDPKVALSQAEHEKGTVPGQQIGLYGNADKRDVRQVVKILNPDKTVWRAEVNPLLFITCLFLRRVQMICWRVCIFVPGNETLKTKAGCYGKETSLKEA